MLSVASAITALLAQLAIGQTIHEITFPGPTKSIARVGDVNNDGSADFAIGTSNSLEVYSGQSGLSLATVVGLPSPAEALASADINNDGKLDLIVGSPAPGGPGGINVYDHAIGNKLFGQLGPGDGSQLGRAVSAAGDTNLDGFVDVIAGGLGFANVYSGANGLVIKQISEPGSSGYGFSVGGGSDVNNDGWSDVIVGDPQRVISGIPNSGAAFVYSSKDFPLPILNAFIPLVGTGGEGLGKGVQLCASLNGDVWGDGLVASENKFTAGNPGALRALRGPFGAPFLWSVGINIPSGGKAFDIVPDKDGDGVLDVRVVQINGISLVSGATGSSLDFFTLVAQQVSGVDDINCDGSGDTVGIFGSTAVAYSDMCGTTMSYGTGCPGSGGLTPILTVTGCAMGLGTISVSITNALGPSQAFIFVGTTQVSVPIPPNCTFLVGSAIPGAIQVPLVGDGSSGSGHAEFPAKLPCSASGLTITTQAWVFDPATALSLSATQGVELDIK